MLRAFVCVYEEERTPFGSHRVLRFRIPTPQIKSRAHIYILSVLQKRKTSNCTTLGISDGLPLRSHRVSAPVYSPAESKIKMSSRATKDPVLTEPGR